MVIKMRSDSLRQGISSQKPLKIIQLIGINIVKPCSERLRQAKDLLHLNRNGTFGTANENQKSLHYDNNLKPQDTLPFSEHSIHKQNSFQPHKNPSMLRMQTKRFQNDFMQSPLLDVDENIVASSQSPGLRPSIQPELQQNADGYKLIDTNQANSFQKYWINPNSKLYEKWIFFLLFCNLVWIQFTTPLRMSFEDKRYVYLPIAVGDLIVDICFLIDSILTFFIPRTNTDGDYIFNRKLIAKRYLLTYFIVDNIANIPYSIFKHYQRHQLKEDMQNFLIFNFAYTPRLFIAMLGIKLIRIRKAKPQLRRFLKWIGLSVDKRNLLITVWSLILMLHLVGCFWGAVGTFNYDSNESWIFEQKLQDEDPLLQYITSLYFAATTIMTVGYGDILPITYWEKLFSSMIFIIGVAVFSFTLSTLASQFSDLNRSMSKRQSRDNQVQELNSKFGLDKNIVRKIAYYFSHSESIISISQEYEINKILKVLPPFLKTNLALFLYKEAIREIPFLQNRDQNFYLDFLDLLIPLKFEKDTVILKKKSKPEEILFILSGEVINEQSNRVFTVGSIIGETDVYFNKRERIESFKAETNVYILMFDIDTVEQMVSQYQDIRNDIEMIAKEREKDRLNRMNQKGQLEEQELKMKILEELQNLLNRDLNRIKQNQTNNALMKKVTMKIQDKNGMTSDEIFTQKLLANTQMQSSFQKPKKYQQQEISLKESMRQSSEVISELKSQMLTQVQQDQEFERKSNVNQASFSFGEKSSKASPTYNFETIKKTFSQTKEKIKEIELRKSLILTQNNILTFDRSSNLSSNQKQIDDLLLNDQEEYKEPITTQDGNLPFQMQISSPVPQVLNNQKYFVTQFPIKQLEIIEEFQEEKFSNSQQSDKQFKENDSDDYNPFANQHEQVDDTSPPTLNFQRNETFTRNNSHESLSKKNSLHASRNYQNNKKSTTLSKILGENHQLNFQQDFLNNQRRESDQNSNIYSSIDQQIGRNIQRFNQIVFIIKRSKLILNEYMKLFTNFIENISRKYNPKYNKILSTIENKLLSPRIFLELINDIRTKMSDQNSNLDMIEGSLNVLEEKFGGKTSSVRELEELLKRQIHLMSIDEEEDSIQDSQNSQPREDDDSFRGVNNHIIEENMYLKAEITQEDDIYITLQQNDTPSRKSKQRKMEKQIFINQIDDSSLHQYSDLYKLDDSQYYKALTSFKHNDQLRMQNQSYNRNYAIDISSQGLTNSSSRQTHLDLTNIDFGLNSEKTLRNQAFNKFESQQSNAVLKQESGLLSYFNQKKYSVDNGIQRHADYFTSHQKFKTGQEDDQSLNNDNIKSSGQTISNLTFQSQNVPFQINQNQIAQFKSAEENNVKHIQAERQKFENQQNSNNQKAPKIKYSQKKQKVNKIKANIQSQLGIYSNKIGKKLTLLSRQPNMDF
eukprot:403374301